MSFDISVPVADPQFDPTNTGTQVIALDRSDYEVDNSGIRQQMNSISAFIDASNVYGSDKERASALRTLDGTGRLKTSPGGLLPFNTAGLENAPSAFAPNFFLAGDIRANEQAALASVHTLFVREHNHWAQQLAMADSELTGEDFYQMAKVIVTGEMQAITYNEFLPLLLGNDALPPYRGYNRQVNPGIANCFSTAAFRLGHSMLSTTLLRVNRAGAESAHGHLSLADAFFDPSILTDQGGIDEILRGLSQQVCQNIDNLVIDDVRNFLFGAPGASGFDLASLNIQRGRDHGLANYNDTRQAYGLPRHATSPTSIRIAPCRQISRRSTVLSMTSISGSVALQSAMFPEPSSVRHTERSSQTNSVVCAMAIVSGMKTTFHRPCNAWSKHKH